MNQPKSAKTDRTKSFLGALKSDNNFLKLLGCISFFISNYAIYGITLLINGSLGLGSFYLNGVLLTGVESFGYVLMMCSAASFRRRAIHLFVNSVYLISIAFLIFFSVWKIAYKSGSTVITLVETGIARTAV